MICARCTPILKALVGPRFLTDKSRAPADMCSLPHRMTCQTNVGVWRVRAWQVVRFVQTHMQEAVLAIGDGGLLNLCVTCFVALWR